MAGGYVGPQIPAQFDQYPIVHWLETDRPPAYAEPLLRRFLRDKQVGAVFTGPGRAGASQRLLLRFYPSPRRVGGVSIFDVS